MSIDFQHGHIRCGTLVVNDLELSRDLYCDQLSHEVVEEGNLSASLANSWGAPALTNSTYCLLQPQYLSGLSKTPISYLRLVQSASYQQPVPHATTYGWVAFEMNVREVFKLYRRIEKSAFRVVGVPKKMDGISNVIPMQVVGPDEEVLYLNQVLSSDDTTDLPITELEVESIFIATLACGDRDSCLNNYVSQINLEKGPSYEIRYSLINRAFGLDPETTTILDLLQAGRKPIIEVDDFPAQTQARPKPDNGLSLGNAILSLVVEDLDSLDLSDTISDTIVDHDEESNGLFYDGARTQVFQGLDGELVELIEYTK